MNELKEINDQLKALSISVEMISQAITGSKLNRNGILQRLETIEGALEETDFFVETPFIDRIPLKRALQIAMQRKWEQEDDMLLTDKEFLEVCKSVSNKSIGKTIEDLVDRGALNMSVNEDGEILYSANKDFQFDKYEDE
jgi:hypothetical protein